MQKLLSDWTHWNWENRPSIETCPKINAEIISGDSANLSKR